MLLNFLIFGSAYIVR